MDVGESSQVGGERTSGLAVVKGDDLFGLPDLVLQFGNGLLGLRDRARVRVLADRELRCLDVPQGVAVPSDLRAMPGDSAVTVSNHLVLPEFTSLARWLLIRD